MSMISPILLLFPCLFLILMTQTTAQPGFLYQYCMNNKGNYTANSTYKANLNTLLSSLTFNTEIDSGFYNFSFGKNSDKVYAIGLCRGDVKPDACRGCLNDTSVLLPEVCPNQKEAMAGYDNCMLRYSNRSLYGVRENNPPAILSNIANATDKDRFNQVLRDLLESLRGQAASGSSLRKYAARSVPGPNFQTVFALVQCSPDLSEQGCNDCLVGAFSQIPQYFEGKIGGRIISPSCNFRYENYRFYEPTVDAQSPVSPPTPTPPSTNTTSKEEKKSNSSRTVIIIVVSIVAFVALLIFISIYLRFRKPRKYIETDQDEIRNTESLQFDFGTISVATDNFSDSNKLGQGGFGAVYMGKLSDGQEIAVKRLSRESGQGDLEFKNEVLLVAKLQHRNLVRLLGFCLEGRERLLIYEFVPNKSLDYLLFDPRKRAQLDWERRYKIIGGIARGLLYLHEDSRLRIIHRDLKASNILLDDDMNPKISDFGMARLFIMDQTQGNTSRIVGTYGYMAPEYAMHGYFSVKSDVYSFGVLVLEIVSGQKNSGFRYGQAAEDLLSFAWKNWRDGTASNLIDPALNGGSRSEIMRCIHIGLLCVQENIADRPTMASIVLMLNSYSTTLPVPSEPAFFMHTSSVSHWQSQEYNSETTRSSEHKNESKNETSITELYPR
ncbi:Cysteine rich receptor like kinase [Quillaja saponaria]|uniref:Cysteine rich receptor like kinase n=1 Tax=Quillaja saponaria TaxID=32244 RepID=A0AAD7P911_QUISA|nr:Cysteine rich receptor like kinase [Quillaja saponaria]